MANKKARRSCKRAKVFRGNQYVNSAGQIRDRNGPSQLRTEANDTLMQAKAVPDNEDNFNLLINFGVLKGIIDDTFKCPECNESVSTRTDKTRKRSCSLCIELKCRSCFWKKDFFTSPSVEQPSSPGKSGFEINLRFVMAFREIGRGMKL